MTIKFGFMVGMVLSTGVSLSASTTIYARNKANFDTAAAAYSKFTITFDDIAPETNIGGKRFYGVKFVQNIAPLIVVRGSDTYTPTGFTGAPHPELNVLIPTSGANVLSPGGDVLAPGSNPAVEDDDITMEFQFPIHVLGFDILSQSADGYGSIQIKVYGLNHAVLFSGSAPISTLGGGGAPAGTDFWGIISDQPIYSLAINEGDNNNVYPDSNIGIDTVIVENVLPSPNLVPDCIIDVYDLNVLVSEWLATEATQFLTADLNLDGVVDLHDFAILAAHWLENLCP